MRPGNYFSRMFFYVYITFSGDLRILTGNTSLDMIILSGFPLEDNSKNWMSGEKITTVTDLRARSGI